MTVPTGAVPWEPLAPAPAQTSWPLDDGDGEFRNRGLIYVYFW